MNWLLAQDTPIPPELAPLLPLLKYGFYGVVLFLIYFSGVASKHVYGLWRTYKNDQKQDDKDGLQLDIQKGEAKLALNIKEEEAIEAQLQRVINQQDSLITKLQAKNEALQNACNEMVGKIARLETTDNFQKQQLEESRSYISRTRERYDDLRKKYYTLKNGTKPDSDVIPPSGSTERVPEK